MLLMLAWLVTAAPPTWPDGTAIVQPTEPLVTAARFDGLPERHWPGPSLWCNRLQDWRVVPDEPFGGALECAPSRGDAPLRTAHLLTWALEDRPELFALEVLIRPAEDTAVPGFCGFLLGAGEGRLDYRGAALVHHSPGKGGGLLATLDTSATGGLSFRELSTPEAGSSFPVIDGTAARLGAPIRWDFHQLRLCLGGEPSADGRTYRLRLTLWSRHAGEFLGGAELAGVPAERLRGNVALVSHGPPGPRPRHRFGELRVGAGRLVAHPERAFGPVAGALYSVHRGTLKLSAQFMSLGEAVLPRGDLGPRPRMRAVLEEADGDGWTTIAGPEVISPPDYLVLFRVPGWDATRDHPVRVRFADADGTEYAYPVRVRRDPSDAEEVRLAAFTGMGVMGRVAHGGAPETQPGEMLVGRWTPANVWLPFAQATAGVAAADPDLLFFTGDQIYEGKPSPVDGGREPYDDYLYKWLLWHWAFGGLTRDRPAFCQPDDHDVYHGNLWGAGGALNLTGNIDDGGYGCVPAFVNMVHRCQTAHHPDAWDRTPGPTGITHYYTRLTWGGLGFAILEDRAFKTPRAVADPALQQQLGADQERFLAAWADDREGEWLKVVVSQTIYASLHVDFAGQMTADVDTNGFPKVARDRSVALFRRAGALVVSGDQHLGTMSRVGLRSPTDGVYQFCTPALANIFWRWFYPAEPGAGRDAGSPDWLGDFTDGFGNPFRMLAVANPERRELLNEKLRQRHVLPVAETAGGKGDETRACLGDGWGLVRFRRGDGSVAIECWPHDQNPTAPGARMFDGWPVRLTAEQIAGR